ncbi:MAG: DNA polymerase III subunit delta' [Streptococcaceae bacterium]|jgi:DNA polymerase-3 subunit delta'|nr:DNA polymerase III subunit delta' [Streptococcaceae bacterium]
MSLRLEDMQPELLAHFKKLVAASRLSHAYLFSGGFGNREMALFLAQAIFCEQTHDGKPDGSCRSCQLIGSDAFMDVHRIVPDGAQIKIDQIRDLLETFSESGFEGRAKVVIIEQSERLNVTAANALLKAIEEPARETFIFLLTDNENRILSTIRSRAQLVNFPQNAQLMTHELEEMGLLKSTAEIVAQLTNSVADARVLAESAWLTDGLKSLARVAEKAGRDAALLELSAVADSFTEKKQQEIALQALTVLLARENSRLTEKSFRAMRYFRANVNFRSALESIFL